MQAHKSQHAISPCALLGGNSTTSLNSGNTLEAAAGVQTHLEPEFTHSLLRRPSKDTCHRPHTNESTSAPTPSSPARWSGHAELLYFEVAADQDRMGVTTMATEPSWVHQVRVADRCPLEIERAATTVRVLHKNLRFLDAVA